MKVNNIPSNLENSFIHNKKDNALTSQKEKPQPAYIYERDDTTDRAIHYIEKAKSMNEQKIEQLKNLVYEMITKQGHVISNWDDMWSRIAKGDIEVDPIIAEQARQEISEDGYWGVTQTSERIFSFAKALSGGDKELMEKMRQAFDKGFQEATKFWGKELPSISKKTYHAVMKLFDEH